MTEPDKDRLTEVELELEQRKRLMDAFMVVQTYDNRTICYLLFVN